MSTKRNGLTQAQWVEHDKKRREIEAAEKAVVAAAKLWYDSRPNVLATAPLALAVQALRELEGK